MKWSWRIGNLAGIDVYIHSTFFLLVLWVIFRQYSSGQSVATIIESVLFLCIVFGIVVLHELGHSLTARRFGIATLYIVLLPIGGIARLERIPDNPKQELLVALAGPAVNICIGIALLIPMLALQGWDAFTIERIMWGDLWMNLILVNLVLSLFNLVPAFPMDGGRVLRAALALKFEYSRATAFAVKVGKFIAIIFGIYGLLYNPFLVFIAMFVWLGAGHENAQVKFRSNQLGIPVKNIMTVNFKALSPKDPLKQAIEFASSGRQQDFPVLANGKIIGVVESHVLFNALHYAGENVLIEAIMDKDYKSVGASETMDMVLKKFGEWRVPIIFIKEKGRLTGILTLDNVNDFLMRKSNFNHSLPV